MSYTNLDKNGHFMPDAIPLLDTSFDEEMDQGGWAKQFDVPAEDTDSAEDLSRTYNHEPASNRNFMATALQF